MINLNDQGQVFPSANQGQSDNGGQAFPMCMPTAAGTGVVYGMTLRDYFAAKALPVVATGQHCIGQSFLHPDYYVRAALDAYKLADAMLRAREEV